MMPARVGATLPSLYVSAVAHAPRGAQPLAFLDVYGVDAGFMSRYAANARSADGFRACVAELLGEAAVPA